VIALVDCNSFYCSCEKLFRPDLQGKPVGVLSNNDGCFVSRTNELKAIGVKMGEPYFKVKRLCDKNKAVVFSANFSLYTNISSRVMACLANFTPKMEIYSVDEAFLDLEGFEEKSLTEYGVKIKQTVYRNTGIPVSVGIGPTKVLAKIANKIAKKSKDSNGVVTLQTKQQQDIALHKTLVQDIWGIGKQRAKKLNNYNIITAKDFRDFKNTSVIQKLLTNVGRQIQDELKAIPCFEVNTKSPPKKEIISSRTFGSPVHSIEGLQKAIANFTTIAGEKLRQQDSVCSQVQVWIRTNPFKNIDQYFGASGFKFNCHTSDTRKLIKGAFKVLQEIYKPGHEYQKASIKISNIVDKQQAQLSFFEENDSEQSETLMSTMDTINQRDGTNTVKIAACGVDNHSWKMRQRMKSPRFVTGWTELPKVK